MPTPAARQPQLELLIEQVARVVQTARGSLGDPAVRAHVAAAVSDADAEIATRVLRTIASSLDASAPAASTPDLGQLDAALRSSGGTASKPSGRPVPATGLRSVMRGRRR